jgi:hypothetical protein
VTSVLRATSSTARNGSGRHALLHPGEHRGALGRAQRRQEPLQRLEHRSPGNRRDERVLDRVELGVAVRGPEHALFAVSSTCMCWKLSATNSARVR